MSRLIAAPLAAALFSLAMQAPAAAAAASNNFASQFPARILAVHNAARAQAGVQPLAWDPALGNAAATYAMQLALTNSFQHSDRRARPGTGENLWMGTHGYYSYDAMVGGWASERRYFVPGVFPSVSRSGNWEDVGHYTQMVWPTTTRVGCAVASNARNDFLVCRYSPAGNIDGRPVPYMASSGIATRAR
jgi:Cysteine-rich secretory protein family